MTVTDFWTNRWVQIAVQVLFAIALIVAAHLLVHT